MSDVGEINFGPETDPFTIMIHSIQSKDTNKSTTYKWIDLLNMIKEGKIKTPLFVTDPKGYVYEYDFNSGNFINEDNEPLVSLYNDIDLINLELKILNNPKGEKTKREDILDEQAKNKIREELEFRYIDLDMMLDNCQGCCDNLEEHFAELRVLKDIIKYLGVDIDKKEEHSRIYTNWYRIVSERDKKEKELKQKKDDIIETLPIPLIKLVNMEDQELSKFLLDISYKINEICNIYRNQVDNKEDL